MGRLSAIASISSPAVRMQQEKSRAVLRIAERAVRSRVFIIARAMPSRRLLRSARARGDVELGSAIDHRGMEEERAARETLDLGLPVDDDGRDRRVDDQWSAPAGAGGQLVERDHGDLDQARARKVGLPRAAAGTLHEARARAAGWSLAEQAADVRVPGHKLDRRLLVAHREQLVVGVVEVL